VMVKYHGSEELHAGDVLAFDGDNETIDGAETFGTVKANATNRAAAIGVAEYRYIVFTSDPSAQPMPEQPPSDHLSLQVDGQTTSFQQGELIQAVVVGHARIRVSGSIQLGDHLAIGSDGRVSVAAKGADDIIGKVAGFPDKDGYVTVFVNLK
jgi:hypothetical protein